MSKRFSPIMFKIPGKPGIFNMEEIRELKETLDNKGIDWDRHPILVEPFHTQNNKCEEWGKMSMDLAVQKFEGK